MSCADSTGGKPGDSLDGQGNAGSSIGGERCETSAAAAPSCPSCSPDNGEGGHEHGPLSPLWRIIVPASLFAAGLLLDGWLAGHGYAIVWYAIMLTAYCLCGLPVLREAGRAILRRDFFNEFTLMGLATLVAIGLGEISEAVGVMLFYTLGEAAQEKAAGSSRRSIQALLASKPEVARVVEEGQVVETRPENVRIGSSILVKPGDKIPLDGVIQNGTASLDLSSITGESAPVRVASGDTVYSGSICLDGDLTITTTAGYSDSMVGKILTMVENAVASKSRTERFITVFSRYYTPLVAAAALLVAIGPPLLYGQPWNVWVYRALVLLVVSCPCALFLSVPLAFFAGIGTASRHGILVKGGQVFDAINKTKTVVFDKTGTLTHGALSMRDLEPAAGVSAQELLQYAAQAEVRSNHPVAKAVMAAAGETSLDGNVTIRDVAGQGIIAVTPDGEVAVGNAVMLRERGVVFPEKITPHLVAYVSLNERYLGSMTFTDTVKADAAEAVKSLRQEGVTGAYMLTGDRPEAAEEVAKIVGLDGYRAGLLPDQKISAFREISPDGRAVFVGDGVNDAPVLAAAGAGVAMGALGSAAAVEAADAVILDDSPSRLPLLFKLAGKTRRIAIQNIAFALIVKAVVMALGIVGVSGLWEAVFADVGVALLAVANSVRMTRL